MPSAKVECFESLIFLTHSLFLRANSIPKRYAYHTVTALDTGRGSFDKVLVKIHELFVPLMSRFGKKLDIMMLLIDVAVIPISDRFDRH